jgi:hypothetical protein
MQGLEDTGFQESKSTGEKHMLTPLVLMQSSDL